jgi:hypothetical protein
MNTSPKLKMGGGGRWILIVILLVILTATFGCPPSQFTLTVSTTPNNGGSVSPGSGVYERGHEVTLIATPAKYYKFDGWGGDVSELSNRITITMNSNKIVVASFSRIMYELHLNQNLADGGRIEPSSGSYEAGNQIRITAIPATGYRFDQWTGSLSATSNPLDLLMDTNKSLTANFVKIWSLSATCDPEGSGSINPSSGTYDDGAKLTLATVANFPYAFDHWGGTDNDNANPTSVTLNTDKSVTAYFTKLSPGTQQIKTGVYNGWEIPIPVQLSAGQWVEIGISSSPYNIPVRILDPNSNVLKDFGWTTAGSFTFQAQTNGTYIIDIKGSSTLFSPGYKVTYTIYSLH